MKFTDLPIDNPILQALKEEGYTEPTEIQQLAIPYALEGKDVLAIAPTGTGKTASFTIPILQHLSKGKQRRGIRALILAPTRELALQVEEALRAYGRHYKLRSCVIMGGVKKNPQISALRRGVNILVATPGRLLDLHQDGHIKLDRVEKLVLDEADRMLDMGFLPDVKRICRMLPEDRQTLFFSATMPPKVAALAQTLCKDPARVDVDPTPIARPNIEQRVMFVDAGKKTDLLISILQDNPEAMVLVFSRTKHRADRVVKRLLRTKINAGALHSNKSQNARQKALADFAKGKVRVLVATDIAARGIDVEGITHVINFDLSDEPENHVHRIGRTARAGADGIAISFVDKEEINKLLAIEKMADTAMITDDSHPFHVGQTVMDYRDLVSGKTKSKRATKKGWPAPRRKRAKRSRRVG
ncbi:MAG: DEAD/DEAH box helicase [Planctomycetes bacterium]|nr:DEAD/DEAH box helicase [Planctomycetota bacterium]